MTSPSSSLIHQAMEVLDVADRIVEEDRVSERDQLVHLIRSLPTGHSDAVMDRALALHAEQRGRAPDVRDPGKDPFDFGWDRPETSQIMATEIETMNRAYGPLAQEVVERVNEGVLPKNESSNATAVLASHHVLAAALIALIPVLLVGHISAWQVVALLNLAGLSTIAALLAWVRRARRLRRRLELLPLPLNETLVQQWLACPEARRYLRAVRAAPEGQLDLRMGDREPLNALIKAHQAQTVENAAHLGQNDLRLNLEQGLEQT